MLLLFPLPAPLPAGYPLKKYPWIFLKSAGTVDTRYPQIFKKLYIL